MASDDEELSNLAIGIGKPQGTFEADSILSVKGEEKLCHSIKRSTLFARYKDWQKLHNQLRTS